MRFLVLFTVYFCIFMERFKAQRGEIELLVVLAGLKGGFLLVCTKAASYFIILTHSFRGRWCYC